MQLITKCWHIAILHRRYLCFTEMSQAYVIICKKAAGHGISWKSTMVSAHHLSPPLLPTHLPSAFQVDIYCHAISWAEGKWMRENWTKLTACWSTTHVHHCFFPWPWLLGSSWPMNYTFDDVIAHKSCFSRVNLDIRDRRAFSNKIVVCVLLFRNSWPQG